MLDVEIRPVLIDSILSTEDDAVIFEELPLHRGAGRADIAAVNGHLCGYEIKSERDSLLRLDSQVSHYESVFDYSTAVVAHKHLKKARAILPKRWGIKLIAHRSDGPYIDHVRRPVRNRTVDPYALARLMWKREGIAALREHNIHLTGNYISVVDVWQRLVCELSVHDLAFHVRIALKVRNQ